MIKHLIKLSNHLDKRGLTKEADYLDILIRRASDLDSKNKEIADLNEEIRKLKKMIAELILRVGKETGVAGSKEKRIYTEKDRKIQSGYLQSLIDEKQLRINEIKKDL